ncbi:MAG TPA: hypothetical protein VGY52_03815, partial [Roseiarcus sp.]|nr:hypothetical protein [Roseiarcus sp.]
KAQQPLEMYGVIVRMLDEVEKYFRSIAGQVDRIYRNNLKFHALTVLGWALNGSQTLPALAVPHMDLTKMTAAQVKAVVDWVFKEFDNAGKDDRTAKDTTFTEKLKADWKPSATAPNMLRRTPQLGWV